MGWIGVVLNQSSGSANGPQAAGRLREVFAASGREVRITMARSGPELSQAAEHLVEQGCESLVAGGGDGTMNAAATAVLARGVPLGVLPLGTLNHFAKDLGIPLDLEQAARVITDGAVCRVDIGEVNGRIFLNNSSLGVYPAIVRLRQRYQATGWAKWLAALWAGLAVLRRNPFLGVRISAEGRTIVRRTPFVLVGNNEYRMVGLQAGSRDSLSSRTLAVYLLDAERRVGLLRLAWQVLLKGGDEVRELALMTVAEATVETRRRSLQVALDGEVVRLPALLHYRIRPGALRVHVPAEASACYPHLQGPSSSR